MNKDAWGPWIKLVEQNKVEKVINVTANKYRPLVATALSVAKWDKRFKGKLDEEINEGLCVFWNEYHRVNMLNCPTICDGCPIQKHDKSCNEKRSIYDCWCVSPTDDNRARMYALLLRIYRKEYKKVM